MKTCDLFHAFTSASLTVPIITTYTFLCFSQGGCALSEVPQIPRLCTNRRVTLGPADLSRARPDPFMSHDTRPESGHDPLAGLPFLTTLHPWYRISISPCCFPNAILRVRITGVSCLTIAFMASPHFLKTYIENIIDVLWVLEFEPKMSRSFVGSRPFGVFETYFPYPWGNTKGSGAHCR